ncbi:purine nucleosidase [Geodermatophilus telluris]|uniref:Purine nucleosidase n=1 Tax=Geodermatophilus telluris TaxID=1190417 RepID=A0A1G6QWX2_9ACTN|nr:nucleoside hydrolase [Geodermatophilus telluris]SDC96156.1 purine nucleosidase [Geodermatophilus telluris]
MSDAGPTPIVLDCDPGHDDAVAILLALGSPGVRLLGITTCFGNCAVEDATRNALRVLALAGREDVPVAAGAAGPMRGEVALGNYVHGVTGLDGPDLPEPTAAPVEETAAQLLRRLLTESPEPVTVVVTGPMTNVGTLLSEEPGLVRHVREIVFMGGSTERGNHTPTAEFNTFADPEALDVVLRAGVPVRMVGLNLTHQALATPAVVERMSAMPHDVGRTCAAWMGFFGSSYERIWEFEAPPVHDPCTIAALLDPDVIRWRDCFVAVELDGTWTRGTTVVDLFGRLPDHAPNVSVAVELDVERYWDLVLAALDALGSA